MKGCMENPLIRLLLKYDYLNDEAQSAIYAYSRGYICRGMGKNLDRRELLSAILNKGDSVAWEIIEEFTDDLLTGEMASKATAGKGKDRRTGSNAAVK